VAVPDFQTFLRPVLETISDGQVYKVHSVRESVAARFKLSPAELEEMLPSGKQTRFNNRIAWAVTFLAAAKLADRKGRGIVAITDRGRKELKSGPQRFTVTYLMKYPEFQDFRRSKDVAETDPGAPGKSPTPNGQDLTPQELLESAHQTLTNALAVEVLEKTRSTTPEFFEHLVVNLLLRMGYGSSHENAGKIVGKSGDEGIDGIISEDRLGLDAIYIQAKRWKAEVAVTRKEIDEFKGALDSKGASKGVFITTSRFNDAARKAADSKHYRIVLIDGDRLARLMIQHNVGVAISETFEVKRLDSDFFDEE